MSQLDDIAMVGLEALTPEVPVGARVIVLIEGPLHSCGGRALAVAISHEVSPKEAAAMMTHALAHLNHGVVVS